MHRQRRSTWLAAGILVIAILSVALLSIGHVAQAQTTVPVTLQPTTTSLFPGDTVTVDVVVGSGVQDLYGAEFKLAFDPSVLEVVDADTGQAEVQIGVGPLLAVDVLSTAGPDYHVAKNEADNVAGLIDFIIVLLNPAQPVSVGGVLATITFQAKAPGQSNVTFSTVVLSNDLGQEIASSPSGTTLTVQALGTPTPVPPTPTPTPTPTPVIPLTVVPDEDVLAPEFEGGTVAAIHPNRETRLQLPGDGGTITFGFPSRQSTFQAGVRSLPTDEVDAGPGMRVLRAIQIDLFDSSGNPLTDTRLLKPATITFKLSDAEIQALGGTNQILDDVLAGRLVVRRFTSTDGAGFWETLPVTFNLEARTFTVSAARFSTYALVRQEAAPTPTPQPTPALTPGTPTPTGLPGGVLPGVGGPSFGLWALGLTLAGVLLLALGTAHLRRRQRGAGPS